MGPYYQVNVAIWRLRRACLIGALLLTLTWQSAFGQTTADTHLHSPRYAITRLPLHPTGINDAGEVVGTSNSFHAATWTKDRGLLEIGVPAGFMRAEGLAINQKGEAVGVALNP